MTPNNDGSGLKSRVCTLAENLGARWSHQAGGYVMSPAAADKLQVLYAAGFSGSPRIFADTPARFVHYERGLFDLTAIQAVKAAKEGAA